MLTLISQKTTGGEDPCHVVTDREGKLVLVSNYSGGSLAVWPLDEEGVPVGEAQVIQHTGKGKNSVRQEGPHVHSITLTRDEKFAVTADLGLDELVLYPVDKKQGRLKEAEKIIFPTGEETGPRLTLFNQKGDRCYVACELSCEVLVLSYENGNFTLLQTLSTLKMAGPRRIPPRISTFPRMKNSSMSPAGARIQSPFIRYRRTACSPWWRLSLPG